VEPGEEDIFFEHLRERNIYLYLYLYIEERCPPLSMYLVAMIESRASMSENSENSEDVLAPPRGLPGTKMADASPSIMKTDLASGALGHVVVSVLEMSAVETHTCMGRNQEFISCFREEEKHTHQHQQSPTFSDQLDFHISDFDWTLRRPKRG
jgi:hypothetical protein